jgi:DNA-binding NarL/FixJ family response regulator
VLRSLSLALFHSRSSGNREIAEQLSMALTEACAHKTQAMQKLGLQTRIDVLRYAQAQGWGREG